METRQLQISSPAFGQEGTIPARFTCEGEDLSPALHIADIPDHAKSIALIMEDPDAPRGTFDHWIVWNIKPTKDIAEGQRTGISGTNSAGKTGYVGPCPPSGSHRYYFYVFALDIELDLEAGAGKEKLHQAMAGHIIGQGTLMGRYEKSRR